jgi:hypothetical protein
MALPAEHLAGNSNTVWDNAGADGGEDPLKLSYLGDIVAIQDDQGDATAFKLSGSLFLMNWITLR